MVEFDKVVDVLVAGTGCAGCSAAIGAALHGAKKVLVIEKSKKLLGGTTKIAGGGWLWCPNNRFLKKLGVEQTPDEILELLKDLAYPDSKVHPQDEELMRSFAEDWPGVVETLLREGCMHLQPVGVRESADKPVVEALLRKKMNATKDFTKRTGIDESNIKELSGLLPSYCAEHPLDLCPSGKVLAPEGGTTSRQLEKAVRKFSPVTEIQMGTQIIDIVFDPSGSGRVIGAVVQDVKTGAKTTIRCKNGVIFATGGFSHSKSLFKKHFKDDIQGTCAARTNTGDLLSIAEKHKIPISGMHLAWLKQIVLPYKFPERIGVFFLQGDSFIVVDRSGKRFACEKDFYQQRGSQMYQNPERKCVFFVFDQRARELYAGPIKGLGGPIPFMGQAEDCMIRGGTVAELTSGIRSKLDQVSPGFTLEADFETGLSEQLDRFNTYARTGTDLEFKRGSDTAQYCWHVPRAADNKLPNKTMFPIDGKNLCCLILGLSTLDTKSGPSINRNGQILGQDSKPIQGLYGAGNCVRSSTNNSYPASGATISNGILFGFNSGKHAMVPNTSRY
mmetsp:Transcript_20132/g.33252  ORF Transcript_20132/g.33252 Transcript_20132/m.33252 type:complete len:559 (-) Transcript_20132:38-1714(-)